MLLSLPLALGYHSPPKPGVMNGTLVHGGDDEDGRGIGMEQKTSVHAFSMFVGNLPLSTSKQWLRELFIRFGEILDIFISRKPKKLPLHGLFLFIFYRRLMLGWLFEL